MRPQSTPVVTTGLAKQVRTSLSPLVKYINANGTLTNSSSTNYTKSSTSSQTTELYSAVGRMAGGSGMFDEGDMHVNTLYNISASLFGDYKATSRIYSQVLPYNLPSRPRSIQYSSPWPAGDSSRWAKSNLRFISKASRLNIGRRLDPQAVSAAGPPLQIHR